MDMYIRKVSKAARFLEERIPFEIDVGVFAGTGLGDIDRSIDVEKRVPYEQIPEFPAGSLPGHSGILVAGQRNGRGILLMQGRFHLYEGFSPREVTFPVRVMRALGIRTLVVTNASGGLNPQYSEGDIMMISDHINLTGENPLVGPNNDDWGDRFPDMSRVYDKDLMNIAEKAGTTLGVSLKRGIYAGLKGPSLETPAEVRFLKTIGADAVGFSTVQEAIAAVHAGMRIIGFSVISNVHDPDNPTPITVDAVIDIAERTTSRLNRILEACDFFL